MATAAEDTDVTDNVPVTWGSTEEAIENAIARDPELQALAAKFESDVNLDPDRDLNIDDDSLTSDSLQRDSDSTSNCSSLKDNDDSDSSPKSTTRVNNGDLNMTPDKTISPSTNGKARASSNAGIPDQDKSGEDNTDSKASKKDKTAKTASDSDSQKKNKKTTTGASTKRKNPLQVLKSLTKFDKSSKKHDYSSEFSAVVVDKLPQVFVVKYLGHRQVPGVCGLHHVRKPVDEMVKIVKTGIEEKTPVELPLLYVVVSPKGLDLREHKRNKVKDTAPLGMLPIDFISYGVQDIKYWRVFTCIVVRELSSRARTATCHAFLCDSSHNGRKMALALGAAFNLYSRKLKTNGKVHNFQIELRPPDQLADAIDAEWEA